MNTVANLAFSLILTVFAPSADNGLARADVWVIDHNLTAEDCIEALENRTNGPDNQIGILSCTLDTDI